MSNGNVSTKCLNDGETTSVMHNGVDVYDDLFMAKVVKDSLDNGLVCFLRLNCDNNVKKDLSRSDLNSIDVLDFTDDFKDYFNSYKKRISVSNNVKAFNSLVTSLVNKSYSIIEFFLDLIRISKPDYNISDENVSSRLCFIPIGLASYAIKNFKIPYHKRAIRMLIQKYSDGYMEYSDNLFFTLDNVNTITDHSGSLTLVGVPFCNSEKEKDNKMSVNSDNCVSGESIFCDPASDILGHDVPKISKNGGIEFSGVQKRVSRSRSFGGNFEAKQKTLDRASQANHIKEQLELINKNSSLYSSRYFVCDPSKIGDSSSPSNNNYHSSFNKDGNFVDKNDCEGLYGFLYMRYMSAPHSVTKMHKVDLSEFFDSLCILNSSSDNESQYVCDILTNIIDFGAIHVFSPVMKKMVSSLSLDYLYELKDVVKDSGFLFDYKKTCLELSVNSRSIMDYCEKKFIDNKFLLKKVQLILSGNGEFI